jgi:hypothetical protein
MFSIFSLLSPLGERVPISFELTVRYCDLMFAGPKLLKKELHVYEKKLKVYYIKSYLLESEHSVNLRLI